MGNHDKGTESIGPRGYTLNADIGQHGYTVVAKTSHLDSTLEYSILYPQRDSPTDSY